MANIQPQIDFIRTAKLGRDVRESIASGLEAMNGESSAAYSAAITAQDSAANSAQQAAQSATDATNAQQAADNSATSAAGSATNANQSATEAEQSATNAAQSANNAQGYLATVEQSAQQATQSATNAADSATNANQSAINAAGSAADANTARQQAMQAAINAQTSATTANNAQTAASISATNAATSEQNAYNYAQQAKAAANIEIATTAKPGIVMPDGTTITIDQFGRISVSGLNEHIAQSLVSQNGVHGVRIYIDPTTELISLQQWNETAQVWSSLFNGLKPDGETITMDPDGTLHGVAQVDVDDAMSESSENPVQNKVITKAFNGHAKALVASEEGVHGLRFNTDDEVFEAKDASGEWHEIETGGGISFVLNITTKESTLKTGDKEVKVIKDGVVKKTTIMSTTGVAAVKVKEVGEYTITCGDATYTQEVDMSQTSYDIELTLFTSSITVAIGNLKGSSDTITVTAKSTTTADSFSIEATGATAVVPIRKKGTYKVTAKVGEVSSTTSEEITISSTTGKTTSVSFARIALSVTCKSSYSVTAKDDTTITLPYSGSASANLVDMYVNIGHTWTFNATIDGETINEVTKTISAAEIVEVQLSLGKIYGFHVNSAESDPSAAVTYLADAVGMTPAKMNFSTGVFDYGSWADVFFMPRPCMLRTNGTVAYYLNPNDYTKKADGTASDIANTSFDGNAMMEWGQDGKKIWYKIVPDANPESYSVYIADHQEDANYKCWSFYNKDNKLLDHFYTAIYRGSNVGNKLRSLSGQPIMASQTADTEVSLAKANSAYWNISTWADSLLMYLLLYLMGKSLDLQGTFGQGDSNGYSVHSTTMTTGECNTKGLFWGSSDNTKKAKVFGMEDPWGSVFYRCLGLMQTGGNVYYKMTEGTADGSTAPSYPTSAVTGMINGGACSSTSGYVTKQKPVNGTMIIPSAVGGSESTYYCDYYWVNTAIVALAIVGGNSNNGANCGFYVNLNNASSNANWNIGAAHSYQLLEENN